MCIRGRALAGLEEDGDPGGEGVGGYSKRLEYFKLEGLREVRVLIFCCPAMTSGNTAFTYRWHYGCFNESDIRWFGSLSFISWLEFSNLLSYFSLLICKE